MVQLADALQLVSQHARRIDTDLSLRRRIAAQQAGDRVQEDRCIPDPPLLRQETEASHAYLSVLMHIASSSGAAAAKWPAAQEAREALKVRLAGAHAHAMVFVELQPINYLLLLNLLLGCIAAVQATKQSMP